MTPYFIETETLTFSVQRIVDMNFSPWLSQFILFLVKCLLKNGYKAMILFSSGMLSVNWIAFFSFIMLFHYQIKNKYLSLYFYYTGLLFKSSSKYSNSPNFMSSLGSSYKSKSFFNIISISNIVYLKSYWL